MSESNVSNVSSRSSSNDGSTHQLSNEDVAIEVKYSINILINKIFISNDNKEFEFPTSLTSIERKYIHKICQLNGLSSTTKGKGSKKCVCVAKKADTKASVSKTLTICFLDESKRLFNDSLKVFELSIKEKNELLAKIQKKDSNNFLYNFYGNLNRLSGNEPKLAVKRYTKSINSPIDYFKDEILNTFNLNRYFYIGSDNVDAGVAVIHFLMDYFSLMNEKCRIVLAEPNDVAAFVVARRLACDLNEDVGQTIGLETNTEIRQNWNTVVSVCTNEMLFKNLIAFDENNLFHSITLIVLNQIHVRDKYSDFLLVLLREKFKNMKFLMIGSTMTTSDIQKIFLNCPFVMAPEGAKKCQEHYLEDILKMTGFKSIHQSANEVNSVGKSSSSSQNARIILLEQWCADKRRSQSLTESSSGSGNSSYIQQPEEANLSQERLKQLADFYLSDSFIEENMKSLHRLLELIQYQKLDVDYQHSITKITALMSACAIGCVQTTESLLSLGACPTIKSCNNLTSLEWAKRFSRSQIVELLDSYNNVNKLNENTILTELSAEASKENSNDSLAVGLDETLLKEYYKHLKCLVDRELICLMLSFMLKFPNQGSIMIFLPSDESINECYLTLSKQNLNFNSKGIKILKIYSDMNFAESSQLFNESHRPETGSQIILTTCIAETLSNFTNVSIIIDSGLTEEISFDPLTNLCSKSLVWTSKLSKFIKTKFFLNSMSNFSYYHLYSKNKFATLQMQPTPQMLSYPTHEICSLAKLSSINTSITDTISKVPDTPAFLQLRNSITYLKTTDVLDVWEDMTELGVHVVLFPFVRHELAKSVVCSLVLKCLEPVLVIAAWITVDRDIFVPVDIKDKKKIFETKRKYADNTFSDHIMVYKIYQEWKKASTEEEINAFCLSNSINRDTFHKIEKLRNQLFDYLNRINFLNTNKNELNLNSDSGSCIKAVLANSLYPHMVRVDKTNKQFISEKEIKVNLSSESVNWNLFKEKNESNFDWLVYDEMIQNSEYYYIKRSTLISSLDVCLFSGPLRHSGLFKDLESEVETNSFKLDSWISFNMKSQDYKLAMSLRQKWSCLMLAKIRFQPKEDEADCLTKMLKTEETNFLI